ncbi:hypothetical protein EXIGLDRAFT_840478 [Exidia glandulosa HHB12029]|uniref:Uncharacterized protein n=1 Tax=Exidia glandulosa HHB12029 TaxID=1314781 RepID=A0A165EF68_EXIGL|nr:hypothetical protein EXIGLDRAFT_840975 [Exidia glandulosa HHB12029]KZV86794.1 hypothetical protein EXIGLDRAFT_840478 [Exidia glandulosa HHB12029]
MAALRRLLCSQPGLLVDPPAQSSLAARLPSNVLCAIFVLFDFEGRVYTSHVCRYWRAVSIAHPGLLWSLISTTGRRRGAFRRQLERAKDVPVVVMMTFESASRPGWNDPLPEFGRSFRALADHMGHVESLHISVLSHAARYVHAGVLALRAVPAPFLARLDLLLYHECPPRHPVVYPMISDDILTCDAPRLTHIRLAGTRFLHSVPHAFRNVTLLYLLLDDDIRPVVISNLSALSSLRDLYLGGHALLPSSPPTLAWQISLRSLHLGVYPFVPWLLPYLGGTNVQNLWMCRKNDAAFNETFPVEDPRLNARAYLQQSDWSRTFEIIRSDGKYRSVNCQSLRAVNIHADFLAYLSDVIVDEEYLVRCNDGHYMLSLPRILRLTVVLMDDPADDQTDAVYDDTLLHCTSHASCTTVSCVSLKVLNIRTAATSDRELHVLGPAEILTLLGHLDYQTTTLARLTISGAELVTHVPISVSQLFDVAEVLLVDPADTDETELEGVPMGMFSFQC